MTFDPLEILLAFLDALYARQTLPPPAMSHRIWAQYDIGVVQEMDPKFANSRKI